MQLVARSRLVCHSLHEGQLGANNSARALDEEVVAADGPLVAEHDREEESHDALGPLFVEFRAHGQHVEEASLEESSPGCVGADEVRPEGAREPPRPRPRDRGVGPRPREGGLSLGDPVVFRPRHTRQSLGPVEAEEARGREVCWWMREGWRVHDHAILNQVDDRVRAHVPVR